MSQSLVPQGPEWRKITDEIREDLIINPLVMEVTRLMREQAEIEKQFMDLLLKKETP